jgi:hypothetical protein
MKVQVLTRSFYEDAYLNFFIRYYLDLGFNRIVIFKADKEELGEFSLDFLQSEEEKQKVVIKYVINEGNGIYKNNNNFSYYIDTNYDWSLHIDVDEFLIIDRSKYQNIHDYIIDIHKIMNKPLNEIYNVKFRWLCINKLNDDWESIKIINPELLHLKDMELTTENIKQGTFYDYVLKNKLEIYSFVKGLYQTNKVSLTNTDMDAHIVIFKKELSLDNRIVIDNKFTTVNKYKSPLYGQKSTPENNYCNGFILHFNTRSYSNSLTKCLVTQLRDNKKISDLPGFVSFINSLSQADLQAIIDKSITDKKKNQLCEKYKKFLNSKRFFPNKIAAFNNKYKYLITNENYLEQIKTVINANSELIERTPFINLKREREILQGLCCKFGINYNNLQILLTIFNVE